MDWAQKQFFRATRFGELLIDPFMVEWKGEYVELTPVLRDLVLLLVRADGVAVPFKALAFGIGFDGFDETVYGNVRCYIARVRRAFRKVDPSFNRIEAVSGVGFRWRG